MGTQKGTPQRKGICFILNTDGGTEHYQNNYIQTINHTINIFRIKLKNNMMHIEKQDNHSSTYTIVHTIRMNENAFRATLQQLNIEYIYVNHLINLPTFQMMDYIQSCGIPYTFFVHDFFSVCPSLNLLNDQGKYCHSETDNHICQSCLQRVNMTHPLFSIIRNNRLYCSQPKTSAISIQAWRERFLSFLLKADKVIAPSRSTKEIIQRYYPDLTITVQPHQLPRHIHHTFHPAFAEDKVLTVSFIGHIHHHKGSNILYELKEMLGEELLPIRIVVIGSTSIHRKPFEQPHFIVTGPYNNEQLPKLLAAYHTSLVITASICPETFSYTTHEALAAGYPVMTFELGAPAQHLNTYGGGWVIKEISSAALLQQLRQLVSNRSEIVTKAQELKT